jgi:hypothetical protein
LNRKPAGRPSGFTGAAILSGETVNGDTEIRVHPNQCSRIMEELKAAGFNVVS